MKATDIAKLLAAQVDGVVRYLLPKGRREGSEWRVGDVSGEPGKSMGVHLLGEKAGWWSDFSSGESGDLVGLWMAVRGLTLNEACREATTYLGVRDDRIGKPPTKTYNKPNKSGVHALTAAHTKWLVEERKISPESLAVYKLASRDWGKYGSCIMFPYLRGGELIASKYRQVPKEFSQDVGCEPCLFGWQAVPDRARSVLICEGEMDALAWHTYGIPALSIPIGAGGKGKQDWVESEFERLALYDMILLNMDGDGDGQKAQAEILKRLGHDRCRIVKLPRKDANECLMDGVPAEVMLAAIRDSKTLDPDELRDIGDYEDAIWAEYHRTEDGIELPWRKTYSDIRLRPGETSIWAGINGHGKSTVMSYIAGCCAVRGAKTCVASMEYRTAMWMMRMNRQIAGTDKPTEQFCRHITRSLKGSLFAFDVVGKSKSQVILDVFRYARRRYEVELFVLDNLTKCGFADDDYPGQKMFVEELSDFARHDQTHVAIVAHMKKGETEDRPAGKFGVKGSGGITDMADTVFEVWRNKPKERAARDAERDHLPLPEKFRDESDCLLLCHKQRANGKEPVISLWYDKATTQFLASPGHRPRPMIQFSAVPVEPQLGQMV